MFKKVGDYNPIIIIENTDNIDEKNTKSILKKTLKNIKKAETSVKEADKK